ncbi:aminotransferase-like domain-containing protein [Salinivibrio sharmensis]|uniref:GntR family transcriptional regulator n=1 Tax=Salinivibrio sharmensis TaxID=390883 RepID=A0ABX3KDH7_9GAMM|nr:PLP-dependent aminotransferase family protein [Salinivibrio sharmensis]OOE87018.1 GntR family transcriptional regulator [Salinivibrio sharmensis]
MSKYQQLSEQIKQQIQAGIWHVGEKLPSLRKQAAYSGLSVMTVLQAYQLLESQGWIVSQSRSGYRVAPHAELDDNKPDSAIHPAESVDINDYIFDVLQASRSPGMASYGHAYVDPLLAPRHQVNRSLTTAVRFMSIHSVVDNLPPGNTQLRHLIAQRYAAQGMQVSPDEIVITAGGLDALNLSLRAVTQPGDWVAVESPAFYGALQALENRGLKAMAIRTHPTEGIDLDALERALQTHPIRACWLMSNHQNPLGYSLLDEKKARLAELVKRYQVYLIEDDVYGELYDGEHKPHPTKAFDRSGHVLHCSSFSKTLVDAFRLGWVAAGDQAQKLQKLQLMSTVTTSVPIQLAVAHYLHNRNYEHHLKQLRRTLAERKKETYQFLIAHLPQGVNVINSQGGYFLWITLPKGSDTTALYHLALKHHISIAPGNMFATHAQFAHCFRLNASYPLDHAHKNALATLCDLIAQHIQSLVIR